jgi:hypothetical protein
VRVETVIVSSSLVHDLKNLCKKLDFNKSIEIKTLNLCLIEITTVHIWSLIMDLCLADYDQVDEAKYFMDQRDQQPAGDDLLITMRSEKNDDLVDCENDFVFLPGPVKTPSTSNTSEDSAQNEINKTEQSDRDKQFADTATVDTNKQPKTIATPDQLDNRSHKQNFFGNTNADASKFKGQDLGIAVTSPVRVAHPLMTINTNNGDNPFRTLHSTSSEASGAISSSVLSSTPLWKKYESLIRKPIGLLEQGNSGENASHLSNLMQQIVTKSDSIYIAIPCAFCFEPNACPPSDISAWLNHMNRVHNCKVCPICNKLVGLGPTRDIEIMQKHVISHINNDWLESTSFKPNFSFGLQNHWFSSGLCSVKDPRSYDRFKRTHE